MRTWIGLLCCLWSAATAAAQNDTEGLLAEARALALAGRHAEAVPLYERLATEVEQQDGSEAWSLVFLLYELAVQHHSLGAVGEAESLYRRSLVIAEKHRGARDMALVPSLRGLATLAAMRGRMADADSFYRRALQIQEADGGSQSGAARTLAELGLLNQLQGRREDAERFYRRALETGETNDLEETEIAMIAGNLGALCAHQGRYDEAEPLYRRGLEIRERLLGPDHPDLANVLEELAGLQQRRGRFAEAASSYQRSLRIREQAGQDDLAVAGVLGRLAATYRQQGRSAAAEAHFGMAKAILDAQCSGRERTESCRDAIRTHRDLRDDRLAPPGAPAPQPVSETIASAQTPAVPDAAAAASPPPPTPPIAPQSVSEATASSPTSAPGGAGASASSPPPPPPTVPSAARTRAARVHRAQVAARQDRREAAEILGQLRDSHPQLLGDLAARVVPADLGERGVWHRVQLGEFPELAEAKALCAELIRRGHEGCWVITTEN